MNCSNCHKVFFDEYQYCPDCGQKAEDNLAIGVLFKDTIGNYLSVDSRIYRSLGPLLLKPGKLAKAFVDGKRQKFLHPARFYLFVSVIFFFLLSFANTDIDDFANSPNEQLSLQLDSMELLDTDSVTLGGPLLSGTIALNRSLVDSLFKVNAPMDEKLAAIGYEGDGWFKKLFYKQLLIVYHDKGRSFFKTFMKTIPISLFFMLPIFAFLLKLFHYKKGPYVNHLVFTFYFFTTIFSILILINLISFFYQIPDWLSVILIIGVFMNLVFGVKYFYNQGRFKSFWKSMTVSFVFICFILPLSLVTMAFVSFFLYG